MNNEQDIRRMYAKINEEIKSSIANKNVDIKEVLKLYSEGVSKKHIAILLKLSDEEISYILTTNMTEDVMRKRQKVQAILKEISGLPKEKSEQGKRISIEAAIKLVEGKGKKRRGKSNSKDEGR